MTCFKACYNNSLFFWDVGVCLGKWDLKRCPNFRGRGYITQSSSLCATSLVFNLSLRGFLFSAGGGEVFLPLSLSLTQTAKPIGMLVTECRSRKKCLYTAHIAMAWYAQSSVLIGMALGASPFGGCTPQRPTIAAVFTVITALNG